MDQGAVGGERAAGAGGRAWCPVAQAGVRTGSFGHWRHVVNGVDVGVEVVEGVEVVMDVVVIVGIMVVGGVMVVLGVMIVMDGAVVVGVMVVMHVVGVEVGRGLVGGGSPPWGGPGVRSCSTCSREPRQGPCCVYYVRTRHGLKTCPTPTQPDTAQAPLCYGGL